MKVNKFLFVFLIIYWEIVGGEAGPTISVSATGMYVAGTAEDLVSGTAGYCYNQSDTPDEFTPVEPVQTTSYTAPQFKITASGVWRFHAKDLAGNTDFKSTSSLTKLLYHCNYCGQDTNSLHYRCPTHYKSQSCSNYSSTCTVSIGTCNGTVTFTAQFWDTSVAQYSSLKCFLCGAGLNAGSKYYVHREYNSGYAKCSECEKLYARTQGNGNYSQFEYWWCLSHSAPPLCPAQRTCDTTFTTNCTEN